jgi:hypothetical protein
MLKRRSCCLASNWFRGVGVPLAMMAYPVKKKDWAAISQASRCTIRLSSCWIWSRIMRYQSRGPRESSESLFRGADMGQDKMSTLSPDDRWDSPSQATVRRALYEQWDLCSSGPIRLSALFDTLSHLRFESPAALVSSWDFREPGPTSAQTPRYPADVPAARDPWFRRDSAK